MPGWGDTVRCHREWAAECPNGSEVLSTNGSRALYRKVTGSWHRVRMDGTEVARVTSSNDIGYWLYWNNYRRSTANPIIARLDNWKG